MMQSLNDFNYGECDPTDGTGKDVAGRGHVYFTMYIYNTPIGGPHKTYMLQHIPGFFV